MIRRFLTVSCLVLIMLLDMSFALAQNPLDLLTGKQTEQSYQLPKVNDLSVKWWQDSIKQSPPEDPFYNLQQLADSLDKYLNSEDLILSDQALQAISQFRNNLAQLIKMSASPLEAEPDLLSFESATTYSLSQLYDYKKLIREMEQSQNQRQDDINALRNDAKAQYQTIDAVIVRYREQPISSMLRLELGLQWLEARSWMALYEKRADLLTVKQTSLAQQLTELKVHVAAALKLITPDVKQIEVLENRLLELDENITKASDQVQTANLKITSPEEDSVIGGVLMDIKKLELAQHMLELNVFELEKIQTKAHLDWIKSSQPGEGLDDEQVLVHVNAANQKESASVANETKWRTLAQDILISPALKPEVIKNAKANEAAIKRTKLAQELLLGLNELDWKLEQVTFIEGLLTNQVIDSKSGLNRWWSQIKTYSSTAWFGFKDMANQPLFKINETPVTLMPLLRLIIIVLIGYLVSKFVRFIIRRVESNRQVEKSSVFFILDKLIHYLIILVATLAGFTTLGIDFTNLTLIAGALSVGIGFGLQNIVSNFVSGLTIMFERSLKVGDYIEMEDGLTGSVMEINARSTRINTNDNIDVIIPNSDLVTNTIINWTLRDSIKRVKIPFGVAYGTEKELVKTAAIEAAENVTYTLTNMKGREPEVRMTGFGDNSLDFILLIWVSKYGVRRPGRIKASYLWELDTAFNKYGIEVPFPQRVLHYADKATLSALEQEPLNEQQVSE